MIAPSFTLAGYALALGVAFGGLGGWKVSQWKENAAKLESERAAAEALRKEQERGERIAEGWAAGFEVIRQQGRQREAALRKELENAVYSTCRVPDSGGLLLDEAIRQANAARKPHAAVP